VLGAAAVAGVVLGLLAATGAGVPGWAWGLLAAGAALALVAALLAPRPAYRFHRWELAEVGLYVQEGWLWRSWSVVPHGRIQTVDTTAGPLERALGLATLEVRTASHRGSTRLAGLAAETAARLRDELAARAGSADGA
jgi:uncharacterized protein